MGPSTWFWDILGFWGHIEIRLGWLGPQMKANLSEYCRQEYLPIEFKEFYCRDILFFPEGYILWKIG
jgi:hypothetical protein